MSNFKTGDDYIKEQNQFRIALALCFGFFVGIGLSFLFLGARFPVLVSPDRCGVDDSGQTVCHLRNKSGTPH